MIKQALFGFVGSVVVICGLTISGVTQAQSNRCELVNNHERMQVLFAPLSSYSQLKDMLPKGATYTMIGESGSYFWIEYGDGERGWIDWHARTNGICEAFEETYLTEEGDTPLTEFPTLCFMTLMETVSVYSDSNMGLPHPGGSERGPGTFGVNVIVDDTVGLYGSIAMSGGFVEASQGTLSGHCYGSRQLAYALDNARVWTEPNATSGTVITTLEVGVDVGVIAGPIQGNVQTDVVGDWVQIVRGDLIGWVWLDRLEMGRVHTVLQPDIGRAFFDEGARLWSAPDAKTGQVIIQFMLDSYVFITGDPVEGNIQLDSDLQGLWYPVQFGGNAGWMYEGQLTILDE